MIRRVFNLNPELNSSISDLAEGLTQGHLKGRYGHMLQSPDYWLGSNSVEVEAIAHMIEAIILGGTRLETLRQVFPNALQYYKYVLQKILGGL